MAWYGFVRLLVAAVAVAHCMLSVSVLVKRLPWFRRKGEPLPIYRVPAGAMLAYALTAGHIARISINRIPDNPTPAWDTILTYVAILAAGTWGFTRIVVITRRERAVKHR